MKSSTEEPIHESATVVLLRSTDSGLEVLMLQKNSKINYGGSWVFPGGVAEDQDNHGLQGLTGEPLRIASSQKTVIRETHEEAGLALTAEQLTPFSNWLTPNFRIKRYNTLFFVASLSESQANASIQIDREEIVDYRWLSPTSAIAEQAAGSLLLTGPSFVTLKILEACSDTKAAVSTLTKHGISYYEPRGLKTNTGVATVYQGDSAYQQNDLSQELLDSYSEVKHRLYMHKTLPWEFVDTR